MLVQNVSATQSLEMVSVKLLVKNHVWVEHQVVVVDLRLHALVVMLRYA